MYIPPIKPSVRLHLMNSIDELEHLKNFVSKERTNNNMTQNELSRTISIQLDDSHDEFNEINSKLYSVIGMLQDTDDNDFNNTIIDYIKSAIKAVELADGLIDNAQAVHFG